MVTISGFHVGPQVRLVKGASRLLVLDRISFKRELEYESVTCVILGMSAGERFYQNGLRNKVNSANQVVAISSRHDLHLITSLQNNLHKQLRSSCTRKPSYQLIMPHICMSIYRVYNIRCFVTLLRCIRFARLFAPATLSLQFKKNLSASHLLYCYRKRTLRISSK